MDRPSLLDRNGAFIESGVVPQNAVALLREQFADVSGRPGTRGFNLTDDVADLIGPAGRMGALARHVACAEVKPVRVLFFDKTPESNWAIPWHQDRAIAVEQRADTEGYGPWSVKDGVVHVEPPVSLLEEMVTLRLFVDDCDEGNGPLQIATGSHRCGRLPAANVSALARQSGVFVCTGLAGDVLVMRTLAVHSSRAASTPAHRRVLHVDYSVSDLPPPLAWKLH
jgi:hypothetical protein